MLRRLFTLFVLLSGLAAIGSPVQARASELPGVGLIAPASLAAECAKQHGARYLDRKRPAAEKRRIAAPCSRRAQPLFYYPPVLVQVDRAHE